MVEREAAGWLLYAEIALRRAQAELDGSERSRERYAAARRGVALAQRYAELVTASISGASARGDHAPAEE